MDTLEELQDARQAIVKATAKVAELSERCLEPAREITRLEKECQRHKTRANEAATEAGNLREQLKEFKAVMEHILRLRDDEKRLDERTSGIVRRLDEKQAKLAQLEHKYGTPELREVYFAAQDIVNRGIFHKSCRSTADAAALVRLVHAVQNAERSFEDTSNVS